MGHILSAEDHEKTLYVLIEIHEGIYKNHRRRKSMVHLALPLGCYSQPCQTMPKIIQ